MPLTYNPEKNIFEYTPTPEQIRGVERANAERLEIVKRVLKKWEAKNNEQKIKRNGINKTKKHT